MLWGDGVHLQPGAGAFNNPTISRKSSSLWSEVWERETLRLNWDLAQSSGRVTAPSSFFFFFGEELVFRLCFGSQFSGITPTFAVFNAISRRVADYHEPLSMGHPHRYRRTPAGLLAVFFGLQTWDHWATHLRVYSLPSKQNLAGEFTIRHEVESRAGLKIRPVMAISGNPLRNSLVLQKWDSRSSTPKKTLI